MFFLSKKEKIILATIIVLIILIPVTSFVIAFRFRAQTSSKASTGFDRTISSLPKGSPQQIPKSSPLNPEDSSSSASLGDSTQISFGPTLTFKINLEGRPQANQAAKIFLGLALGQPTKNPTYLLTFTIDIPSSGIYSGLSIAGLTQGETYTAYLKGPVQIATSAAFFVKPTITDLGQLNLLTGDLNEDNVINSSDYSITQKAFGTTPSSANWNSLIDFNQDNIVNNFDLAFIIKNFGKIGAGGAWVSTPASKQSSILNKPLNIGGPEPNPSSSGYWMFIPK